MSPRPWMLFCLLACARLSAVEPVFPQWRVAAGVEASKGESFWDMRFLFEEEPFGLMSGRSLLKWNDLEALGSWIRVDLAFNPVLGISTRFAWGSIRNGRNSDTDWIGEDPDGAADIPISQSIAETDGDLRSGRLDLWHRFRERTGDHMDFVAGLQWHQEKLRDRGGVLTYDFLEGPLYEPFEGLNSTFDFDWRALRLGLRGENAIRENLRFCWQAVALLAVRYEGEGYWNLRDDFRAEAPHFEQRGKQGIGADLYAGLRWAFQRHWSLEAGVNWLHLNVRDGGEKTYFSDGSVEDSQIREAQTSRAGVSAALSYSF